MNPTIVHKFGGTSVGSAERIAAVAKLIAEAQLTSRSVVVSSAMSGVTDTLLKAAATALRGDSAGALAVVEALRLRHHDALASLTGGEAATEVAAELDAQCDALRELYRAVAWLRELTPRAHDRIVATGEKLAVRLVAEAIRRQGVGAVARDADLFLLTDGEHRAASPMGERTDKGIAEALDALVSAGVVPVVTGFCGRTEEGATTTLGRGGSDFSATLVASGIGADKVIIWTDVDGVYSADPRVVPGARRVAQLNYREAAELSFYGAKVLHQRTMIPVAAKQIPVWIQDSFHPERGGTLVDHRVTAPSHPVKAISAVHGHALVDVAGKGMAGVPGVAARLFGALADAGISVTMISQSSSESSITVAIPSSEASAAVDALNTAFARELSERAIERVVVRDGVALIAAVGLGMAETSGVAGRVFSAMGRAKLNVLAIAQGSSELNVTMAVAEAQASASLRALHDAFGLDRIDIGDDSGRGIDLILFGAGAIGRAFVDRVRSQRELIRDRFGLEARIIALADRSGYVCDPAGLSDAVLGTILEAKAKGGALAAAERGVRSDDPTAVLDAALAYRLARPVLVDVSDFDDTGVFVHALERGCDIATANKKPLAGPFDGYQEVRRVAAEQGRLVRAEATVGAGLPILDTLDILLSTGDALISAQGCLSGTLGYITSRLDADVPFSQAVSEAREMGYTEPDPVADLSGADVARKAVILGRLSGVLGPDAPVDLEGFVPEAFAGLPWDELKERLAELDAPMAARVRAARERGDVLRFVARVEAGRATVGPVEVPVDSPIGSLQGTDNMVVFRTERYDARPLVVSGPGAGIAVTAMGVLGDVMRLAAERRDASWS